MSETKQPQEIGSKIKRLAELRQEKAALNKQLKEIEEELAPLEMGIIEHFDSQDTDLMRNREAGVTVSISESEVPTVTDWDALYEYMKETDSLWLLERRVAAGVWRELMNSMEDGETIPGTEPFTRRKLSVRTIKS